VIIVDELQSLPIKSTAIFNATINAISMFFNTTFVFCTASQPPFELVLGQKNIMSIPSINFSAPSNLVKDYSSNDVFNRVNVIDKTSKDSYNLSKIVSLIQRTIKQEESLLVILNTKKAVNKIYKELRSTENQYMIVCLTTYLVPKHRLKLIENIKKVLGKKKILVLSTPLIEAGVDISFTGVIRSITGLDSIFQAAGRCNRNGERSKGTLSIVNLNKDIENTSRMNEIEVKKEIMHAKLSDYKKNPENYENNLLSQKSLYFYFKDYYDKISNKTHFDIGNDKTIYDLINNNMSGIREYRYRTKKNQPNHFINQAFKEAGDAYRAIEDSGSTVIVPWGGGKDIINNLYSETLSLNEINQNIREAQGYSVNLFQYEIDLLNTEGALIKIEDKNIYVLNEGYYHQNMGLSFEKQPLETQSC
jgi:CRISPR-associated endonuclease/helicase Cas3